MLGSPIHRQPAHGEGVIVHADAIAVRRNGRWFGVLIRGPSGVGKSDLVLRAMDRGFRLVADDRALIWISSGRLFAKAPMPLRDKLEVRGIGILAVPALAQTDIALIIDCCSGSDDLARQPEPRVSRLLTVDLPVLDLIPTEPSALQKLDAAITILEWRTKRRI